MGDGGVIGSGLGNGERLRGLVAAGIALTSELSLESLLRRLAVIATEVTGAKYAAIGVLDPSGRSLEQFVTAGVDDETRQQIGDPPHGRGILGLLIKDARALRLSEISQDPHSVGFPPGHPPMRTFLGVPIRLRGVVFGNLYLTEKLGGGDFTDDDQELALLLAGQAAVAIDNARLYETATSWMRQLESLGEITRLLSDQLEPDVVVGRVCERVCELVDAETALVALVAEGELRPVAIVGENAAKFWQAHVSQRAIKARRVLERGRSERIDSTLDDPEMDQQLARELAIHSALMIPMQAAGEPLGVLMVFNRRGGSGRFPDTDMRLAELFAERAAQAIDVSNRVSRDVLARVIAAQERERQRLARELHDDTQQMLAAILIGIRRRASVESPQEREADERLARLTEQTIAGIRRVTHHLSPPALEQYGLSVALRDLAAYFHGSAFRTHLDLVSDVRLDTETELALYRVAQEALTNAVKHAGAANAWITHATEAGTASISISDDGVGFDPDAIDKGLGLIAMLERLELLGGALQIRSRPGSGTTISAQAPCSRAAVQR